MPHSLSLHGQGITSGYQLNNLSLSRSEESFSRRQRLTRNTLTLARGVVVEKNNPPCSHYCRRAVRCGTRLLSWNPPGQGRKLGIGNRASAANAVADDATTAECCTFAIVIALSAPLPPPPPFIFFFHSPLPRRLSPSPPLPCWTARPAALPCRCCCTACLAAACLCLPPSACLPVCALQGKRGFKKSPAASLSFMAFISLSFSAKPAAASPQFISIVLFFWFL